ncbi:hypothetical protein D9M73_62600 [compost metagenome]
MRKNAIAFLAGLGSGALAQHEKQGKQKREDEDRALRNEAAQLQIDASKKAVSDQKTIAQAGLPVEMVEGAGGMVKPETMDNRDVGLPENAELPNQGLQQGGYSVGGKAFTDPISAQAELTTQNAPEARTKRVIAAMSGIDPMKAMDLENQQTQRGRETIKFTQEQEAYAKRLKDEGAIDALKSLRIGDAAGMTAAFNKGGEFKILGEPVLKTEQRDIPGVGAIPTFTATFQVQGKDGQPKEMTVNSHDLGMSLMPYEKWYDAQLKGAKEGREGREATSKIGLQNAQAGYYESAAGAKDTAANKMSEIDKSTLSSINKQRETINSAITKAQAEGSYDPNSPGTKALGTKLAALAMQESQLQARYAGDAGGAKPDPLGVRGAAPSGGGGPLNNPAAQGARDVEAGAILMQEYGGDVTKAQAAANELAGEVKRAKGNAKSILQSQLTRLQIGIANASKAPAPNAAAGGLPTAPKPAPAAAPAPAPAAAPAAAPSPAPVVDEAAMQAKIDAEQTEMGNGKRMKYSPEVKAYLDKKRDEKDKADQAASKEYRDREAKRAIAASKGLS